MSSKSKSKIGNFITAFKKTVKTNPKKFILHIDSNSNAEKITYEELYSRAINASTYLNTFLKLRDVNIAILYIESSIDFFVTFWACILSDIKPIVISPNNTKVTSQYSLEKLKSTLESIPRAKIITSKNLIDEIENISNAKEKIISFHELERVSNQPPKSRDPTSLDILFIQLSSGSTGKSKLIPETHGAVIQHIRSAKKTLNYNSDDISLNWLPFDHVVPLLSFHLRDIYLGCNQIHVAKELIISKPYKWLEYIQQYKVTNTWAPNFAFKLINNQLEKTQGNYDLSSIKVFINAGEQITKDVMQEFCNKMSKYKLKLKSIVPAFGMAEIATCITYKTNFNPKSSFEKAPQATKEADSNHSTQYVSLGKVINQTYIRIDNKKKNVVGELEVKGPTVFSGYLNNSYENKTAFTADGWFKTGDLAFIKNEKLYITGRKKDTLNIRGNIFHAHELETYLSQYHELCRQHIACISCLHPINQYETCIIVASLQHGFEKVRNLKNDIKRSLASYFGINPIHVIFIPKKLFRKTSSGKIQRSAMRDSFESGEYEEFIATNDIKPNDVDYRNPIKTIFFDICCEYLPLKPKSVQSNFFACGGDSLIAIQCISKLNQILNKNYTVDLIFQHPKLNDLIHNLNKPNTLYNSFDKNLMKTCITNQKLTKNQNSLWYLWNLKKKSSQYNVFASFVINDIDIKLIKDVLLQSVNTYKLIGSKISLKDNEPYLKIPKNFQPTIVTKYVDDLYSKSTNHKLRNLIHKPFNLNRGKLYRLHIFVDEQNRICLNIVLHHIICDGWSMNLLLDMLCSNLTQHNNKLHISKTEHICFSQYCESQQEISNLNLLSEAINYFRASIHAHLKFSFPIQNIKSGDKKNHFEFELNKPVVDNIRRISRTVATTPAQTLLAIYTLLINKYSQLDEFNIGIPLSNRDNILLENTFGYFVNLLPMTIVVDNQIKLRDFIQDVSSKFTSTFTYRNIPLQSIVHKLNPDRDLTNNPIFDVIFAYDEFDLYHKRDGINLQKTIVPISIYRVNIVLNIHFLEDHAICEIEFDKSKLNIEFIKAFSQQFQFICENIQSLLDINIEDISIHTTKNIPVCSFSKHLPSGLKGLYSKFRTLPTAYNNKIAIYDGNRNQTFFELHKCAINIAKALLTITKKKKSLIGLYMSDSTMFINTLLGILLSGNSFLMLDNKLPEGRISDIINIAKPQLIITDSNNIEQELDIDIDFINVNNPAFYDIRRKQDLPEILPSDPAYVIFTSGTTGSPKMITIYHCSLNNLITSDVKIINTDDIVAAKIASISFDASIFEIFYTLFNYGTLVIFKYEETLSPQLFFDKLKSHHINTLLITPTHLLSLLSNYNKNSKALSGIKNLFIGGEEFSLKLIESLPSVCDTDCTIINAYGPAECTVISTIKNYSINDLINSYEISIGKPIQGVNIQLCNELGNIVAPYIIGEVLISGINHITIDCKKNIHTNCYKTGDIGYTNYKNEVILLGRKDKQLKINGSRLEPKEIELALSEHNDIAFSYVCKNHRDDNEIAAYIKPKYRILRNQSTSWLKYYEDLYRNLDLHKNLKIGWNIQSTEKPIAKAEMEEYVNNTVGTILNLCPRNILEIGCGSGMLIEKLLDKVESYTAQDYSENAINFLKKKYRKHPGIINFIHSDAAEIELHCNTKFDLVILNSVTQYFPDIDYLTNIMLKCSNLLEKDGVIFIGDVVNYCLKDFSHKEIEKINYFKSELHIAPNYFTELRHVFPQKSSVEINLKKSVYANEFSKFRFDVTIFFNKIKNEDSFKDCSGEVLENSEDVNKVLSQEKTNGIVIRNLPNPYLNTNFHNIITAIGESYFCQLSITSMGTFEFIDLYISSNKQSHIVTNSLHNHCISNITLQNINGLDSNSIIRYLSDKLPKFMVPPKVYLIPTIFLNHNSKLDVKKITRSSIQAPIYTNKNHDNLIHNSEILQELLIIWKEHLKLQNISANDDYFMIGGHSLLAIPLVISVGKHFSTEISVEDLIKNSTPKSMSKIIELNLNKNISSNNIHRLNIIQEELSTIWGNLLGLSHIRKQDEFFSIGGHSLMILSIISKVEAELNATVTIEEFIRNSTIDQLSKIINGKPNIKCQTLPHKTSIKIVEASSEQKRIFFIYKLTENKSSYNIPIIFKPHIILPSKLFINNLHGILKNNRVFYSTYFHKGSTVFLDIAQTNLNNTICIRSNSRIITDDANHGFDLEKEPPFKAFINCDDNDNVISVLFVFHHIIFDGWSYEIFKEKLTNSLFLKKTTNNNPDFVDYLYFKEKNRFSNNDKQFWGNELTNLPTNNFPINYERPKVIDHAGDSLTVDFGSKLSVKLNHVCKNLGVSENSLILSCYLIMLHKYTTNNTVTCGMPFSNREITGVEKIIGFFSNTLVLKSEIFEHSQSMAEYIKYIHQKIATLTTHQSDSFQDIVDLIKPDRVLNEHVFFNHFYSFYKNTNRPLETSTWTDHVKLDISKFDFSLYLWEKNSNIVGYFEYATSLYSKKSAENILETFLYYFSQVLNNTEICINNLLVFKPSIIKSRQKLTADIKRPLYKEFLTAYGKNPSKTAIYYLNQTLSFKDLYQLTACAIRYLQRNTNDFHYVLIELDKQPILLALILACSFTKKTFVLLSTTTPLKRKKGILKQLCNDCFHITVNDISNILSYNIAPKSNTEQYRSNNSSDTISYIMFTSGTTSKPKGVQIKESSLMNFLFSIQDIVKFNSEASILSISSLSFDICLLELLLPLITSGSVTLIDDKKSKDPYYILNILKNQGCNFLQATPSMWNLLFDADDGNVFRNVNAICGGEKLTSKTAKNLAYLTRNAWNMYGPTETTIWSTSAKITKHDNIVIGEPVANTICCVLDKNMKPVPKLAKGELYIGGEGVTSGYIHSKYDVFAELTIDGESTTFYKTGDVVYIDENNMLNYSHRVDFQAKYNGIRFEPEEIELYINNFNKDINSIVNIYKGHLSAFIFCNSSINIRDLIQYLRQYISSSLIPGKFYRLNKLALNLNGKVQRDLITLENEGFTEYKISKNNSRKNRKIISPISSCWKKILKVEDIQADTNFFEEGGNSLKAIELLTIMRTHGYPIPLAFIFQNPVFSDFVKSCKLNSSKNESRSQFALKLNVISDLEKQENLFITPLDGSDSWYENIIKLLGSSHSISTITINNKNSYLKNCGKLEDLSLLYTQLFLKHYKKRKVNLIGWSFASIPILELYYNHPEMINKIILIDPPPGFLQGKISYYADTKDVVALYDPNREDICQANLELSLNYTPRILPSSLYLLYSSDTKKKYHNYFNSESYKYLLNHYKYYTKDFVGSHASILSYDKLINLLKEISE